ncbi:hypothetical protein FOA43_003028 [Brettanomyces nanus]|uniref:Pheromone-regulated membrane protein 10 n=1 Tax=Eeniella nana TaxID=13502 RepID=A0A875RPZ5_EENNA|nr:uncharacterized protein FOA43_003028 [Brettanomyces nanus]QPG75670.1 hypothetical protein FOA43_003028 [Brettanomyces nanus]
MVKARSLSPAERNRHNINRINSGSNGIQEKKSRSGSRGRSHDRNQGSSRTEILGDSSSEDNLLMTTHSPSWQRDFIRDKSPRRRGEYSSLIGGSRSRDLTPARSARSAVISGRPITIAEGEELDQSEPLILPVFSASSTNLRVPDESQANVVPYPAEEIDTYALPDGQRQRIHEEIEDDFDKEFDRDISSNLGNRVPHKASIRRKIGVDDNETDDENSASSQGSLLDATISNNGGDPFTETYQLEDLQPHESSQEDSSHPKPRNFVDLENQKKNSNLADQQPMKEAKDLVDQYIGRGRSRYRDGSHSLLVSEPGDESVPEDGITGLPRKVRSGVTSNLMRLNEPDDDYEDYSGSEFSEPIANKHDKSHSHQLHHPFNKIKPFSSSTSSLQPIFSKKNHRKVKSSFDMPSFSRTPSTFDHNGQRSHSADRMAKMFDLRHRFKRKLGRDTRARITVHIADILQRQRFLLTLCKAFMGYDPSTKTSDVKVVRVSQGFNLAKLDDAHEIYKSVVHDRMGVEEASQKLDQLLNIKSPFNRFWLIVFYGLSSSFIIIWFDGSFRDMAPSFVMGCIVGFFQLVIAPTSSLYSSVFEVASSILLSFIGRAIGSINHGKLFCFSAIVQSGLAMILPGYTILSGALEIQSRSIVSGTVRMFYAIIFSMFLGFGMTLGSALYGWMDKNAIDTTTCNAGSVLHPAWNFLFIPAFTVFATLGVEARFSQLPVMVIIACGGYAVDYFSAKHFGITQFSAALGAFTVGLLSNLYSRFGMPFRRLGYCSSAFTSMYPGIIDLVPGSIASRNVLAAGLNQLKSVQANTTTSILDSSTLTFGITMIEVSIGISVGLFLSAIFVYPFGKERTGIFSL